MKIIVFILLMTLLPTSSAETIPTTPIQVNFNYKDWGSYYTVSYAGEQYFAGYAGGTIGYINNIITFNTTSNSGQMHRVLMNENVSRILKIGDSLPFGGGYVLKVKDLDITGGRITLLNLFKDGYEVDMTAVTQGSTYVYTRKVGNIINLPLIAVHLSDVSSEARTDTFDGIFQISEEFINVTTTNGSSSYVTVTPSNPPPRTPIPTPTPTKGSISISSSPSGASIYLDSAYQGITPKTITDTSIGTHYLEIKLEGYKPWSDSIEVRADSTSYVSIQLTSTPIPATPASTPTLTPTITITETPTPTPTSQVEQEVKELKERLNKTEEKQSQQESRISWLESTINSIINWFKSIF